MILKVIIDFVMVSDNIDFKYSSSRNCNCGSVIMDWNILGMYPDVS